MAAPYEDEVLDHGIRRAHLHRGWLLREERRQHGEVVNVRQVASDGVEAALSAVARHLELLEPARLLQPQQQEHLLLHRERLPNVADLVAHQLHLHLKPLQKCGSLAQAHGEACRCEQDQHGRRRPQHLQKSPAGRVEF
jgi:hypothetical protein